MKTLLLYCMAATMMAGIACKKSDTTTNTSSLPAEEIMNVSYGADAQQKMDIYLPQGRNTTDTKTIILLHGGAWSSGDKADLTATVQALRILLPDYAFFNVNYRLATTGSNLWPTQLNDLNTAFNFITSHADHYKYNVNKVAIGGASSGAHLAMLKAYGGNTGNIKAVIDLFGPTDMTDLYNNSSGSAQALLALFMSGTPASNPAAYTTASPLSLVNASAAPTIILHGTADNVVPIHQSDNLNDRLASFSVAKEYHKYPGEIHGTWSPSNTADAFAKVAAFVKLHVK